MRRFFVGLVMIVGCAKAPAGETVIVPATAGGGTSPSPSPSPSTSTGESVTLQSEWREGLAVVVRGKVSKMPNQHLMGGVTGKRDHYFDVTGGSQTVVYATSLPACGGELELRGKVIEVRGGSKRPGETKMDSSYSELHVDVESARCLDATSLTP